MKFTIPTAAISTFAMNVAIMVIMFPKVTGADKLPYYRGGHRNQPDPTPPGCQWEGTAPFCNGQCSEGWRLQAWNNCGNGACCLTGNKVLCCQP